MPVKNSKSCSKRSIIGPTGPQGLIGLQGPIGPQGIQGPIGPQGYGGDKYQTLITFKENQRGAKQGNLWSEDISFGEIVIATEKNLSFVPGTKVVVTPVPELPVNYYDLNDLSKNESRGKAYILKDCPWSKRAIRLLNSLSTPH